ncbi:MAG: hypothetical protein NVS2B16_35800 [Chloroflexota bacterium]
MNGMAKSPLIHDENQQNKARAVPLVLNSAVARNHRFPGPHAYMLGSALVVLLGVVSRVGPHSSVWKAHGPSGGPAPVTQPVPSECPDFAGPCLPVTTLPARTQFRPFVDPRRWSAQGIIV